VQFRSSVSESVGGKIGGSINFINNYQYDTKAFFVNGPYNTVSGSQTGIDGAYICASNMEIYAIMMFNLVAGSSGDLEFDLKRFTASGGSGTSIFSTKPKIPSSSGNNAYLGYRFSDSTILEQVSGSTLPVLTSVNLDAGDMLTCDITLKQTGGQNGGLVVLMRPRN
jgi:hypothetical protein